MTRAEKLEAAGTHMHCTCPRHPDGTRETWWHTDDAHGTIEPTEIPIDDPNCKLHGPNAQPAPF